MKKELEIKLCREEDLDMLEKSMPTSGLSRFHHKRFENQEKGRVSYLIAWLKGEPVGHIDLRWYGFDHEDLEKEIRDIPELNAITVAKSYRNQGIGTALIEEAEKIAKERGFKRVGMGVNPENEGAKRLYEKLGYKDSGTGLHLGSWEVIGKDGNTFIESEEGLVFLKDI